MSKRGVIKAYQQQLHMSQDAYVQLLQRVANDKTSSKQLTNREIDNVLIELERLGAVNPNKWREPLIKKIQHLWLNLRDANKLDNPHGMNAFCKKFVGDKGLYKADTDSLNKCIESLKSWCKREGLRHG